MTMSFGAVATDMLGEPVVPSSVTTGRSMGVVWFTPVKLTAEPAHLSELFMVTTTLAVAAVGLSRRKA